MNIAIIKPYELHVLLHNPLAHEQNKNEILIESEAYV